MSNNDSFIEEVSEEVRRDRLYGLLRRYGWIGAVLIVLLVGGASVNEYLKAQSRGEAQALGDALLAALESDDAQERQAALEAVSAEGDVAAIVALLVAAERLVDEDPGAAATALMPIAQDTGVPVVYSDLAALKLVLLGDDGVDATTRAQLLDRLAQPGAPYALLAREQQALALASEGRAEEAIAAATALLSEPGLTVSLQQRLLQLVIALGGTAPQGEAG